MARRQRSFLILIRMGFHTLRDDPTEAEQLVAEGFLQAQRLNGLYICLCSGPHARIAA